MINSIRTYHLRASLSEPVGFAQGRLTERDALLVEIVTQDGIHGWGECAGPPSLAQAAIKTLFAPLLLGKDPLQTDLLWHTMWQIAGIFGRRGSAIGAISGLDMALWDAKGQAMHQPLCELFGGRIREKIPCAAVGLYFREVPESQLIQSAIDEALAYKEAGFRAIKLQVGRNIAYDMTIAKRIREALPTMPLFAEAHHAYDLPEAISVGRALSESNFSGFSEPLSAELPEHLARLSTQIGVPICDGSNEQTRWGFQSLLGHGGVQLLQPDLSWCGGPSEMVRIGAIAGSLGVNIVPRTRGTLLNQAAALHYLAADFRLPGRVGTGTVFLETEGAAETAIANPLRTTLFSKTLSVENGLATVPNIPGLGVTIDQTVLASLCVEQDETHA
jgi:D-galactarolactone cycloisomerase